MKADDLVDLVFVTPHNFLYVVGITRQVASDQIRVWFHAREEYQKVSWFKRLWRLIRCWPANNTYAINHLNEETEESFAHWAIGAESIIGIYIREREATHQEKIARAAEKMADVLEKEANKGEEWK